MGTTFSTLADHAVRINMTHETMIGVILAIPFFLKFYQEALIRYSTKEGQISIMERIEENHQDQYQTVPLLKHRTLLRGTMPDLVPSSNDSVSTAVASNTAKAVKAREMVEPVDLFPLLPSTIVMMEQEQDEEETVPSASEFDSVPDQTFAAAAPIEAISFHPNDLYESDHSQQHLEEQSFLNGQNDDDLTDANDEYDEPQQSTADYLESVAQALTRKARHADHADKVGIANALMELGNILWKERKNQEKTLIILKYAETVQRIVIDETIASVASAMAEQGKHHEKQGNKFLAHVYGNMAKELHVAATPMNLKKSIELHHQHKARRGDDSTTSSSKALQSLTKKLDRRIKRASAEAVPLVQNFKTQAQVNKVQASHVM